MVFPSKYATHIWDTLYTVYIPDQLTLNKDYIRRFGVYITQNKQIDEMLKTNFVMVKIPIIKILEYFLDGIEIQIPSREDMIQIHKHIEAYLSEWREHIRTSVHGNIDAQNHKDLILSLEKLSKYIYEKAQPKEVLDNLFLRKENKIGIMNPMQQHMEMNKPIQKPDYQGIAMLIKRKNHTNENSGNRF